MKYRFTIIWIAAIIQTLCCLGCNRSRSKQIHFIVPTGYEGKIEIVVDSMNGVQVPFVDHAFQVRIPSSGILRIKDDTFLSGWHQHSIFNSDGANISHKEKMHSFRVGVDSKGGAVYEIQIE